MDVAPDTKSPIESLPLELACMLFEYASESINAIRMVSSKIVAVRAVQYI